MYADAKYLIRNDITSGSLASISTAAIKFLEERLKEDRMLIYHNFEYWARTTPDVLFLIFEDRTYTYKQFFEQIGRVGNWLIQEYGIKENGKAFVQPLTEDAYATASKEAASIKVLSGKYLPGQHRR